MDNDSHSQAIDEPFFRAWTAAVGLFRKEGDYFVPSHTDSRRYPSKWDLCPNVGLIRAHMGPWSTREAIFAAALVTFYHEDRGQELLMSLGRKNMLAAVTELDAPEKAAIFRLSAVYRGW